MRRDIVVNVQCGEACGCGSFTLREYVSMRRRFQALTLHEMVVEAVESGYGFRNVA